MPDKGIRRQGDACEDELPASGFALRAAPRPGSDLGKDPDPGKDDESELTGARD